eukprot:5022172-Pyramimonas_sp.AAC.1
MRPHGARLIGEQRKNEQQEGEGGRGRQCGNKDNKRGWRFFKWLAPRRCDVPNHQLFIASA